MRSTAFFLMVFTLLCSEADAQKIARSAIGSFGSSVSGKTAVVAFNPVSSPVVNANKFSDGRSIQTKPFLHLRPQSMLEDIQLSIYPNPTSDWVNIETNETYTDVVVVDVFGKTCYQGWAKRISMKNFSSGLYTIHLTLADHRVYSKKLIYIK